MKSSALGRLGRQYGLDGHQTDQLEAVLTELARDEHAPTTVRDQKRAAGVHLADSLVALELDVLRDGSRVADLGSGAGFPGLALAVALPKARVSLVESQQRKCRFLERVTAAARIENVRIVCTRAEEWTDGLIENDVVVVRALAAQPVVLEYAAPLLRRNGTLIDWRGQRDANEEREAECAARQLGLRASEIRHCMPYEGARDHHLHVFEKLAPTPSRFPRRAGVARKRPLGC